MKPVVFYRQRAGDRRLETRTITVVEPGDQCVRVPTLEVACRVLGPLGWYPEHEQLNLPLETQDADC